MRHFFLSLPGQPRLVLEASVSRAKQAQAVRKEIVPQRLGLTGGAPPNSIALASMGSSLRCATGVGMDGSRLGNFLKKES